jgi:Ca-activated chloride channel family protein
VEVPFPHPEFSRAVSQLVRIFCTAIFALAAVPYARAADPTVMIVFDGSGSFWGRLGADRRAKLDITRDALRDILRQSPLKGRVGLTSFGHRRRGDCSDAEVLLQPEPGPPERITSVLDKLNPRGKGPSTLALREAAKAIGDATPASIVMIQDGPDNCQQDICAAAADIAKSNPHLAVYTVTVGLDKAEAQRLSCVAGATGGKLFEAGDADAVKTALGQALKLASLDKTAPPEPVARKQAPAPAAPEIPSGPPGLKLSASLSASGPQYEGPLIWIVRRENADHTVVRRATAPTLDLDLDPGKYVVEARLGPVMQSQPVTVVPEHPTPLRIDLNAGQLQIKTRATEGGPVLDDVVFLATPDPGLAARIAQTTPEPIWISRNAESEVTLPAGAYVISIEHGLIRRRQNLVVQPGGTTSLDYLMGAGRLELSAVARTGGEPLRKVIFQIAEDDPESPQGRREIARSASSQPAFSLPAGTYYVTAQLDGTEVRERIALGAGDDVQHVLNLGLAELHVQTAHDRAISNLPLIVKATRIDSGGAREVTRSSLANPTFALAAGRYRIEARIGNQNVSTARDVTLATGEAATVDLQLEAAAVTLRRTGSAQAIPGEAAWEVDDASGKVVWRSSQDEPHGLLAPGRYTVRSEHGDQKIEASVELKAGEQRTVELGG